jgi:uncharacterized membrane protein YgdD (TMEM256/DUF423 family)
LTPKTVTFLTFSGLGQEAIYPVPVGGISFIIGWLMLAIGTLGFWGKN